MLTALLGDDIPAMPRGVSSLAGGKGVCMAALFIVWSKQYETGIAILDEQYRGLVSLINCFFFHRNDVAGDITKVLVPTAKMFKSYVKIYCATVEKLMRDSNYPERERYEGLHAEMIHHIEVMELKYRRARDAQGFLNFLKEYWLDAIEHQEKEYLGHLTDYYAVQEVA